MKIMKFFISNKRTQIRKKPHYITMNVRKSSTKNKSLLIITEFKNTERRSPKNIKKVIKIFFSKSHFTKN
jgi:hypothetical protein